MHPSLRWRPKMVKWIFQPQKWTAQRYIERDCCTHIHHSHHKPHDPWSKYTKTLRAIRVTIKLAKKALHKSQWYNILSYIFCCSCLRNARELHYNHPDRCTKQVYSVHSIASIFTVFGKKMHKALTIFMRFSFYSFIACER